MATCAAQIFLLVVGFGLTTFYVESLLLKSRNQFHGILVATFILFWRVVIRRVLGPFAFAIPG